MPGMLHQIIRLALLALVSGPLVQHSNAQAVDSKKCATGVHVIVSRGQGTGDDLDVMSSLTDLIQQQISGSTILGLPYDHGAKDKFKAVSKGAVMLQKYVREYADSCPESKVAIIGYSLVCLSSSNSCLPILIYDWFRALVSRWKRSAGRAL